MALKKPAVTARVLQVLLTRIGSASSGTKSLLLARFRRNIQRSGLFHPQAKWNDQGPNPWGNKVRIMSIDMGIKNLAFCDAEVSYPATKSSPKHNLDATMNVLRWKKIDLVESARDRSAHLGPERIQEDLEVGDDDIDQYSPSILSKTAYHLITEEVLSANPDIILIEKQRWRSGGGSAVQQWTVRVNTLEAMLWAILETLKMTSQPAPCASRKAAAKRDYHVYAADPKRVGQYWLGQHARALEGRNQDALALDVAALANRAEEAENVEEEEAAKATKKLSRSKAEKSAKIALLRSWLADGSMSTGPSTPSSMPRIAFHIDPSAEPTRQALFPKVKATRRKKTSETLGKDAELAENVPATEMKKLDDITDCFLQAAAWVAWESNRLQLVAVSGGDKSPIDEDRIVKMIEEVGDA